MLYGGDGLLGSVPWVTDGLLGLVNLPLKHLKRTGFKMTGVPGVCFLFECCLHDKVCTPQPLPRAEQPMTCFSSAESAWAGEEGELKGTKKNLQSLPQVSWVYCNKREQMLVQAQIPLSWFWPGSWRLQLMDLQLKIQLPLFFCSSRPLGPGWL